MLKNGEPRSDPQPIQPKHRHLLRWMLVCARKRLAKTLTKQSESVFEGSGYSYRFVTFLTSLFELMGTSTAKMSTKLDGKLRLQKEVFFKLLS